MTDTSPTPADRPADQLRAVLRLLEDAQSYLSVLHGTVGRHDHIGANLACDGCALRDRITPALAVAWQLLGTTVAEDGRCPVMTPGGRCEKDADHRAGRWPDDPHVPAAPPAPADRAAVLTEAADFVRALLVSRPGITTAGLEAELRTLADDAATGVQPPTSEAHPAEHTWAAELHDPLANEWVPGTRYAVRDRAVNALEHGRKVAPLWKDGTPTERRLVRATTTYTVEPEPAAPAAPEEPTSRPPRILVDLCEQHRPVIEPDPTTDGQHLVSCNACDDDRTQTIRHGDPVPECRFWAMGKAYGYVTERLTQ